MAPLGELGMTDDGRYALRFERRLAHPRPKIWRALTDVRHLRWWFVEILDYDQIQFEPVPGARLTFVPKAEHAGLGVSQGEVTRVREPELLEYTWSGEVLRWELEPDGEAGCRLVFTNIFDDRGFASAMGAGWHAGLARLEDFLDGRDPDQSVLALDEAAWQRLQADYDATLGERL